VAPDHPEVKVVENRFEEVCSKENVRLFCNVNVGVDISMEEMKQCYDAIILACGAEDDRKLGLVGEDLGGVYSAREFVGWYNGLPKNANDNFEINTDKAVIIGNGNVAVDIARIVIRDPDELKGTDIIHSAWEKIKNSGIKEVHIIGRRGPVQSAFTTKELRELTKLQGCRLKIADDELLITESDKIELKNRAKFRQFQLLESILKEQKLSQDNDKKTIYLHFLKSPIQLNGENKKLKSVILVKNKLIGDPESQVSQPTDKTECIETSLLFRSIGYKSIPMERLPFDFKAGIIPHSKGKIISEDGLYVSGWIKRGPTGIINTNIFDAQDTVDSLLSDFTQGTLKIKKKEDLAKILTKKNIRYITYSDWKIIDKYEKEKGEKLGKVREKLTSLPNILRILNHSK